MIRKTKITAILLLMASMIAVSSANDFVVQDNSGNNLFVVNQSGEKQIKNGKLYLNGNAITDQKGSLNLEGGNVKIQSGNLNLNDNIIQNVERIEPSSDNDMFLRGNTLRIEDTTGKDLANFYDTGNVEVPNGYLDLKNNEIRNVGKLTLGWRNLTDYPTGCDSDQAVRVIGDTLDCAPLNPGGTVETGGGSQGQVAFFSDSENITGTNNFYWDNPNAELGIATNNPSAKLDVNGQTNLRSKLLMNSNNIQNPGLVDGINLDSTGNAITIDGSNRYQIATDAIDDTEIASNSITASGSELDSSVSGNYLNLNSGSLNVQDNWVDQNGDTMTGNLQMSKNDIRNIGSVDLSDTNSDGHEWRWTEGSGGAFALDVTGKTGEDFKVFTDGDAQVSRNLQVSGKTDSVDLDNPGNGISINSNQYVIPSNSIDTNELNSNSVTNTELANSDSYQMSQLTVTGDTQVQGNLDVFGNITNTDVQNLNVNGSLLPPSRYTDTFDVGSPSRRWRTGYFQDMILGNDAINNNEIANPQFTINANSGLTGGGTPNLGGTTGISHADTSTQPDIGNSGGMVIQDLTLDDYGHITTQNSYDLDNRYYTETESNNNFVDESGDTMTGNLDMGANNLNNMYILKYNDNNGDGTAFTVREPGGGAPNLELRASGTTILDYREDGEVILANGPLNMNNNQITNYFAGNCNSDSVVKSVYANGSYNCQSITGASEDTFVNEAGDTMTGNLDMGGNNVQNVGTVNANIIQDNGNDIQGLYVDESGDSMSGSLNMQNNHIDNINYLEMNSEADIRSDGTDALRIDSSQNLQVPNGRLKLGTNQLRWASTGDNNGFSIKPGSADNPNLLFTDTGSSNTQVMQLNDGGGVIVNNGGLTVSNGNFQANGVFNAGNKGGTSGFISFKNTEVREDNSQNIELSARTEALGDLAVSGTLSAGTTECNTGEYIDGDGTCTSVTGETQGEYVDESGDTMTGTLNMNSNSIINIGSGNIQIDESGAGDIKMNGQELKGAGITQSNNIVAGSYSTGTSNVDGGDIWVQNDVEVQGDIVGGGADVAEKIQNETKMTSGTVVAITGNMSVSKTTEKHQNSAAGVVSTDPAMIMAKERDGVPIAMTGTAPVKVTMENGEIKPGDTLTTSSTSGKAMKCQKQTCNGSTIGKALQPAEKPGKIKMLISLS